MLAFLRKYVASAVLELAADYEERLLACEQQLGSLTQQARRSRLRSVRTADDALVEDALAALRASSPGGSAGVPASVPDDKPETKSPSYVAVARKARGT
jgi:hypothetical protein